MPTKIIRTVIGGHAIETPVEIPEVKVEVQETPKPKRGRSSKKKEEVVPDVSEEPASAESKDFG